MTVDPDQMGVGQADPDCYNRPVYVVITPGFGYHSYDPPSDWMNVYKNDIYFALHQIGRTQDVYFIPMMWDSGTVFDVINPFASKPPSLASQAATAEINLENTLRGDPRSINVLLIGHSRGAIFNNTMMQDMADRGGRPGNVNYIEEIMLDPTAAIPYDDVYPNSVPTLVVDHALQYDDTTSFDAIFGNIRHVADDGRQIFGAEMHYVGNGINSMFFSTHAYQNNYFPFSPFPYYSHTTGMTDPRWLGGGFDPSFPIGFDTDFSPLGNHTLADFQFARTVT